MDDSDERSSGPETTQDSATPEVELKRRTNWWLVAGLGIVAAVAGFYSSVRSPADSQGVDPAELEKALAREMAAPAQPQTMRPPPGPLEFLSGQSPPGTVETLIEEARRVTQVLVDLFPGEPSAHDMVARVHHRTGAVQEAVRVWEKALEIDGDYSHAYLGLADAATEGGENEKAVSLLRKALVLAPDSFDAQIQLAQALVDLNRMPEAIRLLESNVAVDPRPYRGRVLLGMAYLQLEDYEQAKANYEAAIEAHPKHANAYFGLATACARLGQQDLYEKYIAEFEELRAGEREIAAGQRERFDDLGSMSASMAQIYTDAAKIFLTKGGSREAEILCRRAALLDANNTDCRQALAWMYLQQDLPTNAVQMLEELSRIDPDNLGYRLEIARLYGDVGNLQAAEQTLREVCQHAPDSSTGYVALAHFLIGHKRDLPEAVEMARTAVRLDPSAANQVLLSSAYEASGQLAEAIAAMQRALELAPESLQYQQMYALLKEKEEP